MQRPVHILTGEWSGAALKIFLEHRMIKRRKREIRHPRDTYLFGVSILLFSLLETLMPTLGRASGQNKIVQISVVTCGGSVRTQQTGVVVKVAIPLSYASQLSIYAAHGIDILGPRNWQCFSSEGNVNDSIWIYPIGGNPTTGPVISEWRVVTGFGGGRENLPIYGGRYFPKVVSNSDLKQALDDYNATFRKRLTTKEFLAPRYLHDEIRYLGISELWYLTPPNQNGLGPVFIGDAIGNANYSSSRLPTVGILAINTSGIGDLIEVAVRLSNRLYGESSFVLDAARACAQTEVMSACNYVNR
jgi:hypothetical protein